MALTRLMVMGLGAGLVAYGYSRLTAGPNERPSSATEDFVDSVGSAWIFAIRSARAALERAESSEIRTFAALLIKEHSDSDAMFQTAAKGFAIPVQLDLSDQERLQKLLDADPSEFDLIYLTDQGELFANLESLFSEYLTNGVDQPVMTYVGHTLPTIRRLSQMLEKLP